MTTENPGYYRDLLRKLEETIELDEARIDTLRQLYVPKIEQVIDSIKIPQEVDAELRKIPGEIPSEKLFNWIASKDPGKNNPATQWMLDRVIRKQNPMPLEDIIHADDTLSKFLDAVRTHTLDPEYSRDLNKYTSLSDIDKVLQGGEETKNQVSSKDKKLALDQSDVLYNGPDLLIVTPKTQLAAAFWGQSTNWCTAYGDHLAMGLSTQGKYPTRSNNMFDNYNKQGPLYVVINKQNPEERYQFHWPSMQFMDKDDRAANTLEIADKFPVLWKIFAPIAEKNNSLILNEVPSDKTKKYVIGIDPYQIKNMKNPSPELQLDAAKAKPDVAVFLKNPIKEVQMIAVMQNGTNLIKIRKNLGHDLDPEVQMAAVKNNGLSIKGIANPSEDVQMAAVTENGDAIRYIINNLGKKPSIAVQRAAVENAYDAIEWIPDLDPVIQIEVIRAHKDNEWALKHIQKELRSKDSLSSEAASLLKQYGVR